MSRPSTGAATPAAPVGGDAAAPAEGTGSLTGINKLGYAPAPSKPQEEMLARSLADYRSQAARLAKEVEAVSTQLHADQRQHTEVANYLSAEVQALTERTRAMQAALDGFKGEADAREQRLMAAAEAKFARLQFDTSAEITRLTAENAACKQQLADVRFFREDKENVEQGVRDLKVQLAAQAAEATAAADQTERNFLLEFERQRKAAEARIEDIKRASRAEATKQIDAESAALRIEVVDLRDELRTTQAFNDVLRKENDKFRGDAQRSRLDAELNESRDAEYAKRGVVQQRSIKELQTKNKTLERSLTQVLTDFETEKKQWAAFHERATHEAKTELVNLRQLIKLKTRELAQIKRLSKVILDQRSEVEQFMLEAIDQVKTEVARKRDDEYKAAKAEYSRQLREATLQQNRARTKFPTIGGGTGGGLPAMRARIEGALAPGPVAPPPPPHAGPFGTGSGDGRVELRDLSPEDRERVLRLLFARMNGAQAQPASAVASSSSTGGGMGMGMGMGMGGSGAGHGLQWSARGDSSAGDPYAPMVTPLPDSEPYSRQRYTESGGFDHYSGGDDGGGDDHDDNYDPSGDRSSFMITQQSYDYGGGSDVFARGSTGDYMRPTSVSGGGGGGAVNGASSGLSSALGGARSRLAVSANGVPPSEPTSAYDTRGYSSAGAGGARGSYSSSAEAAESLPFDFEALRGTGGGSVDAEHTAHVSARGAAGSADAGAIAAGSQQPLSPQTLGGSRSMGIRPAPA